MKVISRLEIIDRPMEGPANADEAIFCHSIIYDASSLNDLPPLLGNICDIAILSTQSV